MGAREISAAFSRSPPQKPPCGFFTRRIAMLFKITLVLALAFAVGSVLPASAGPRTCGSNMIQYDSSGTWTGPYCD
jgi:hypothetical protein